MKLPERINSLANLVYQAIEENNNDAPRYHLGASEIGGPCDRKLWLNFRWAIKQNFNGRILRLFRRGKEEELPVIRDLRAAGCVIDFESSQEYFEIIPHFGGSTDGLIKSGVPESPGKEHILEIKTHSKKSFDDLIKNSVQKSKPEHYAQMQVYMGGSGVERALYFAVCKDDDRIYDERVRFDSDEFDRLKKRAEYIINSDRMVEPVSADPSWYQCKMCHYHGFCHDNEKEKIQTNCRTCEFSSAEDDGWFCNLHEDFIPKEYQLVGCDKYERHGDLL